MKNQVRNMLNKIGIYSRQQVKRASLRGFEAALKDRLTASWGTINTTADFDLKNDLKSLRARSRDLATNNDYARKFIKSCDNNIIGKKGIGFQSKVKDINGNFDKAANDKIENGWSAWGKDATIEGNQTWKEVQSISVKTMVRDGEILINMIKGYNNKFGFALQLIEADHLDEEFNTELANGNYIRMGIEFNRDKRPIAYHVLKKHPGDYATYKDYKRYERVPAENIIHLFDKERVSQSRGFPWMASAMKRLNMLGGYEYSELVSARVSAAKMGFYEKSDNSLPGEAGDYKDEDGNFVDEADPGKFSILPKGYTFKEFDPTHPSGNFDPFTKAVIRGAAAGMGLAYHSLSGDLTDVNYSSGRLGALEERDNWRVYQNLIIEKLCSRVFIAWLEMALLTQAVNLPFSKFDKFNSPSWQPRQFDWVDPLKDINANIRAIDAGLKSRSDVAGEQGKDFQEIVEQLAWEKQLMIDNGIFKEDENAGKQKQ